VAVAVCSLTAGIAGAAERSGPEPGAAASPVAQQAGKAKHNRFIARMERGLRKCANGNRRRAGLGRLRPGASLGRAARFHAQSMSKGGVFGHVDRRGRGPARRVAMFGGGFGNVQEVIGAGYRGARAACRTWMRSGVHRANILRRGFTHLGAGYAGGGPYERYYVVTFGRGRG
jgi:uncharacterized protein YkwD